MGESSQELTFHAVMGVFIGRVQLPRLKESAVLFGQNNLKKALVASIFVLRGAPAGLCDRNMTIKLLIFPRFINMIS